MWAQGVWDKITEIIAIFKNKIACPRGSNKESGLYPGRWSISLHRLHVPSGVSRTAVVLPSHNASGAWLTQFFLFPRGLCVAECTLNEFLASSACKERECLLWWARSTLWESLLGTHAVTQLV